MKVYLVGGAVRDELLGMAPEERDWVVVGASAQQLLDLGYRQVGRDFPVFLHPESGDEYALARTERKKGHGYTGFEYDSDRSVTLEQDLQRRDLTINAMARTDDGQLIDPYGGRSDLEARVLRHVSPAFVEDPLRVLRVARFAARFHDLGFRIAPETAELMRELTDSGELAHLVPERIWQETLAALMTDAPHVYMQVLRDCGALQRLFPELERLFGVPQTARYHPEIDTGIHLLLCLKVAARLQASQTVRVAVLLHDLGKGVTPEETLPSHIGHERAGLPLVRSFGERLKLSRNERELAEMVCLHHLRCHQAVEMKPASLLRLLEDLDAWRRPQRFEQFLLACEIDARGRKGLAERSYASRDLLQQLQRACASVSAESIDAPQLSGPALGDAIRRERGRVIADLLARLRCVSGNG